MQLPEYTKIVVGDSTYRVQTLSLKQPSFATRRDIQHDATTTAAPSATASSSMQRPVDPENAQTITATIDVPKQYHKHLIGRQGATIKALQFETGTSIEIPRYQHKSADPNTIRIHADNQDKVDHALSKIRQLVEVAQRNTPYSHFISLPLALNANERWTERVKQFHRNVEAMAIEGYDKSILVTQERLHLTLGMLRLDGDEQVEKAVHCMRQHAQELYDLLGTRSLVVRVRGLALMKGTTESAHCIYANVEPLDDRLTKLIRRVLDLLVAEGLMPKEEAQMPKLHMSVLNTSYRKGSKGAPFDATLLLDESRLGSFDFGEVRLESVDICQRLNGKLSYESEVSISLP